MVGASTIGYRGDVTSRTSAFNRREQAAWRGFVSMQAGLRSALAHELQQRFGLSEPDYAVLVELSEAPAGGLRLRDLGTRLSWDKSRLSKQIGRMAARGLVERRGHVTDGRGAVAVLTETGRDALANASPLQNANVRKWFISALTPEQLDAIMIHNPRRIMSIEAGPQIRWSDNLSSVQGAFGINRASCCADRSSSRVRNSTSSSRSAVPPASMAM